ncbi:hypothetical protein MasN3_09680 [Massilia varians]|uniref:Uncharacterized protein n=1 Tax=Massilia varians TaxID=457921 RepID=A0ABN6T5F9_9BURK|nr:hypothetical protein MasN3_09680 [Massilia varians]
MDFVAGSRKGIQARHADSDRYQQAPVGTVLGQLDARVGQGNDEGAQEQDGRGSDAAEKIATRLLHCHVE